MNNIKTILKAATLAVAALLLTAGASFAQQQVNLTAAPTTTTLPDGTTVPMWGYSCAGTTVIASSTATCTLLNPAAAATLTAPATWSPVVITVPTGQNLTINLTNSLSFGANSVPTSLVIVGQLGGGLGTTATSTFPPDHSMAQQVTWPIASPGAANTPPTQGNRVQSFSTEVAAGATTALTFGTVTNPLRPGTYLIESGTHPSIQGPMGLYGILVVTTAPAGATAGRAYPAVGTTAAVTYNAEIPLLLSEIDPVQNNAVAKAVTLTGFSETTVWSGQPGGCGNPATLNSGNCYPPAVNYTPLYYLFNGVAFNKTSATTSLFAASPAAGVTGNVLVRFVNAGLRMHVPSIVGSQTGTAVAPATIPPTGFSLIAEDGNTLPGVPRVQSEVFLPAGKTYDVMINVPAAGGTALPVFDRQLSLSGNGTARDAGMLAYIGINGAGLPAAGGFAPAVARADTYNSLVAGQTFTVSDPGKGVIANDTNVYGVKVVGAVAGLTVNTDGTFTYTGGPTSFTYCANGTVTGTTCSSGVTAMVTLGLATLEAATGIVMNPITYTSNVATSLSIKSPGVLSVDKDNAGYPLTVVTTSVSNVAGPGALTLSMDKTGAFNASVTAPGTYTFTYMAQNSQGTVSGSTATVTLIFLTPTNLVVKVLDGKDKATVITDYRWIIEEDRTFYVNPNCTTTSSTLIAGCPTPSGTAVPITFGTNFHTSYMPVVATGCVGPTGAALACEAGQYVYDGGTPCTSAGVPAGCSPTAGQHVPAVCDIGNGVCRPGPQQTAVNPSQVHLDPTKRYYLSVLPGDAGNPFKNGNLSADCINGVSKATNPAACGHGMGGTRVVPTCTGTVCVFNPVTVFVQPDPYPPSKLSVFVFQDDFPLNGEHDAGGGTGVVNTNNEPGLGQFNITLFDDAGGTGDATGQMTYDMFNQPLVNSLAGTIDPLSGLDACPISINSRAGANDPTQTGITGTIVTCPQFESDGMTPSPLAGQAVVANLMPGRYGVVATPGADRIARGEEWLQTNTLDGQKAHDSFLRIGEPSSFQEYGPAGYHVSIGFANPAIINGRKASVCAGTDPTLPGLTSCTNTVTGLVTTERVSRTPDERLYGSGDNSSFAFTQCYVSFGDPDGEDFAFTKCNGDGSFSLSGLPDGDWRVTVFDQWNDVLVDGLSTPVRLTGGTTNVGNIATNQWQANIYTKSFFDQNGNGIQDPTEPGLTLVPTNIRFRDGSYSNFNNTDLAGNAGFNEVFPLFSWYVVESDTTRFKNTGTHVVYDAGGPADGTSSCGQTGYPPCGSSTVYANLANTAEQVPLPASLRVPGAKYCAVADCITSGGSGSTGRIDPPWVATEGWQGFSGQNSFIEFGKKPYAPTENGGIHGEVIYASTRPFDDPGLLIHTSWTPDVPGVTINLYKEGTAADNVTTTLTLVDTTETTSWDDWAQGFRSDGVPNMNCPGQATTDLFYYTLLNQPNFLDVYNNQHNGTPLHTVPNNSQFKCYDGMHNWNQVQPAPYDGMYQFPSVTSINPTTGKPAGTNCTICVSNPDTTDSYWAGLPMLPAGKYVVEMVVPPGYELVKEEDKNILIGDNYIAPVTQEFPGLGSAIYILPDQAEVGAAYNANNAQNPTQDMGRTSLPSHEGDTGSVETFWPCVGASRIVPDYISLFPQSHEVAPFAGATRNLCDRKEVTLDEQTSALAKFWIFTSAHVAAHFTGVITDDYTSEFDPFSPQFGEKFSPPNLPISIKDWTGTEISRVYSDQWGTYDGLTYSTWEVNPPNPTGYAPTMMVTCMNDPGPIPGPNGTMITDPLFDPQYSQFCYEIPFMPGQTQYMDTPVVPTAAFAGAGYNNVDCAYPDATPAIKEVDGSGIGPWVPATGGTLTITALGDQMVPNYAYAGPSATTAPYNAKTVKRHYGFGAGAKVTIGGVPATCNGGDLTLTCTVPQIQTGNGNSGVQPCLVQQQAQYGGSTAYCGELVITAANGKQSIDSVTVTIGGKAPTHVLASGSIQNAIDAAAPGDMIIVDPTCTTATGVATACTTPSATNLHSPSAHNEMLIMWKPIRLQGVGAAASIINANVHPAGKVDVWRAQVDCLFGLAINGSPISSTNPYDSTGAVTCGSTNGTPWNYFKPYGAPGDFNPQVDRLPLEATVGWDAELNGNLAEQLQEPSLMGALEGAGITVLAKGVNFPSNPYDPTLLAGFPTGTTLLQNIPVIAPNGAQCTTGPGGTNLFPSNYSCNPSSIDGLGITDSSQGGGGIFIHGWGHNLQIANNRINNNAGTLSGGINVGQGEYPPAYIQGSATNAAPGSCEDNPIPNAVLPYCQNVNLNIHHNDISLNSSTGDELFSATPAGAGGVSICTGSDYYKFNYNWVCGNLSSGDGGGLGHLGYSSNGDIEHNTILFNQSTNPTIPANGGGMIVMGSPDADIVCNNAPNTDQDCVPFGARGGNPGNTPLSAVGPSDGVGPGLVINANLILGNTAESGSGGGIAFQAVNGSDMVAFPANPNQWNSVTVTNNIIADNVAGWDGGGISLLDSTAVNIINNTIINNVSTASAGPLFNTIGADLASTPPTSTQICPGSGNCGTRTRPQIAGVVAIQHSAVLRANLPRSVAVTCPTDHPHCRSMSYPKLENNIIWRNSSYNIRVGALSPAFQQHVVTLVNASFGEGPGTPVLPQTTTGACVAASYWDIGVRGDQSPSNHVVMGGTPMMLNPTDSVLSNMLDYNQNNSQGDPHLISSYCNGARTPPETPGPYARGWQVPPGISDATVPNPIFSLTPAATVDEGNNWVNMRYGPLSLTNPTAVGGLYGNYGGGPVLGNFGIMTGSSAAAKVTGPNLTDAPNYDFFNNPRKTGGTADAGAIALTGTTSVATVSISAPTPSLTTTPATTTTKTGTITVTNTATGANAGSFTLTAAPIVTKVIGLGAFSITGGTCANGTVVAPAGTCTIIVQYAPSGTTTSLAHVTITDTGVATTTQSSGNFIAN